MAAPADPAWPGRARVLLVLAAPDDPRAAQQAHILSANRAGATERELVLLVPTASAQARLRRRYDVTVPFAVLLIGKDGGVKRRSASPMAATTLFDAIDAMPMRRMEMHRSTLRPPPQPPS